MKDAKILKTMKKHEKMPSGAPVLRNSFKAYSFIANKITRNFNMVLLGGINNSNRHIIKTY